MCYHLSYHHGLILHLIKSTQIMATYYELPESLWVTNFPSEVLLIELFFLEQSSVESRFKWFCSFKWHLMKCFLTKGRVIVCCLRRNWGKTGKLFWAWNVFNSLTSSLSSTHTHTHLTHAHSRTCTRTHTYILSLQTNIRLCLILGMNQLRHKTSLICWRPSTFFSCRGRS